MRSRALNEVKGNSDIKIVVEKVRIEGNGVIILTGPSSCGKGEIAKAFCKFLSLPKERHLSMGEILRMTIKRAKEDIIFQEKLSKEYGISNCISIFDEDRNRTEVAKKAESYKKELNEFFKAGSNNITQFNWLEFCVNKGLLIPDEWSEKIMDAILENTEELHRGIFILDGYPRTINASKALINTFKKLEIPIIKVIHLSITKEEMKKRAFNRNRCDDTEESLERRYQFYIDKVQPCIDYIKENIGSNYVSLIDAHQPVFNSNCEIDLELSIKNVVASAVQSLGLPSFLLDL